MVIRRWLLAACLSIGTRVGVAQDAPEPRIVPRPVAIRAGTGQFTLSRHTVIVAPPSLAAEARRLAAYLRPATGLPLPVVRQAGSATAIVLALDSSRVPELGREGYTLSATSEGVTITAAGPAGVFYGIQTLRQLLPPAVFSPSRVRGTRWVVPAVEITDYPRFPWRGMHLDVARHFMPKAFVKRYIDLLALHKMNTFHWHLTDDQGWRLQVRRYPRLTSVGAWRRGTIVGRPNRDTTKNVEDRRRHGGYYTQADVREIVAYAAARHVRVVPEVEMPGHVQAAIAAYPALGVTGDTIPVWTRWGVSEHILNADDATVRFMQNVLAEVLVLFPGNFIHVGGDEAVKTQWDASPRMQQRMKELGAANPHELQSWFIHQMDAYLTSKGRRLVGWDEILEGGIAPGATVMSWRGTKGGIEAARTGHDVVMTPTKYTYFDYYQSADTTKEPLAIGGFLPLDSVYAFEPVPAELKPDEARHILGAQGQLWTEYMPDGRHVEYMAYPRGTALAEVLWTPVSRKSLTDFRQRLDTHLERLDRLRVNYRRP